MSSFSENDPNIFPAAQVAQADTEQGQDVTELVTHTNRHPLVRTAEWGAVVYETSQIDDKLRYLLLGGTYALTRDTVFSASVYALTTFGTEATAGMAGADLLASAKSEKFIARINKILEKLKISPDAKVHKAAKAVIALYLGTPTYLGMHQRENPSRSFEDNKRTAVRSAAAIAGVCAVEGYALSSSIDSIIGGIEHGVEQLHPEYAIPALVALAGIKVGAKRSKEKFTKNEPRYDLAPEKLEILERRLIKKAKKSANEKGICVAWLSPYSRFANVVRTHEGEVFKDDGVDKFPSEAEDYSLMLAIISTKPGEERLAQVATLMGPSLNPNSRDIEEVLNQNGTTGFETIDALIRRKNFTGQEFINFYRNKGIDLTNCICIETNIRIGDKIELLPGLYSGQVAYLSMFKQLVKQSQNCKITSGIFASINAPTVKSFRKFGLTVEPLMDRTDLQTPEAELGKDYMPVFIPPTKENYALFEAMSSIELPEITF